MAELAAAAQPTVSKLVNASEDDLYQQLGVRLQAMKRNPQLGGSFDPAIPNLEALGPVDDLRQFGKLFFNRISQQAFNIACGSDAEDADDRKKLQDAFGIGKDAVAAALAALLVSQLGLAAAVAGVVAALVVKLFFNSAYQATCDLWKTKLPASS